MLKLAAVQTGAGLPAEAHWWLNQYTLDNAQRDVSYFREH